MQRTGTLLTAALTIGIFNSSSTPRRIAGRCGLIRPVSVMPFHHDLPHSRAPLEREAVVSRYRKIDVRIWNDEKFSDLDPIGKLAFLALLTHPIMTPMGAGVFPSQFLDSILGNEQSVCWRCLEECGDREHFAERYAERFAELSLIVRDKHLVIVLNYLLYNAPQNPNQLASWITSCEELPRSDTFAILRDHLKHAETPPADWIFAGLLDPLADGKNHGLEAHFWERMGYLPKPPRKVSPNLPPNVSPNVPPYHAPNTGAGAGAGIGRREEKSPPARETLASPKGDESQKDEYTHDFLSFWTAYPRKEGKGAAWKAWQRTAKMRNPLELTVILAAIERHKDTEQWDDPKFIPHPATWLNQRRWEDEPTPGGKKSGLALTNDEWAGVKPGVYVNGVLQESDDAA